MESTGLSRLACTWERGSGDGHSDRNLPFEKNTGWHNWAHLKEILQRSVILADNGAMFDS